MKILFLTNKVPYPAKDGGSIASMSMIKTLSDAGHSVTVLSMNTNKHHITPYDIPKDLRSRIIFHLIEVPAKITIQGLVKNLLFSKIPYNAERFIDKNYKHYLESLLQANKYDIIQLEGLYLCPYIDTIRESSVSKIAYRSHNIEHEIWERTLKNSKGIKRWYLKILYERLKIFELSYINKYDLLIPITPRDENKLNESGNNKPSATIPAGFDFAKNEPSANPLKNDIFFIGALDWTPNQEGLTWFFDNCWEKIKENCPKVKFFIAGRNAPDWFIKYLNKDKVEYIGEVQNAHIYIRKHGVMIAPLLSGGGMRVKIIEGMSLKKPIVTTSIGCEGIDAQNEKEIFIADQPEEFIDYTTRLIKDIKLQSEISNNCYTFVKENFSNEKLATHLIEFYKNNIE